MDACRCFVCGKLRFENGQEMAYMLNISGFVKTKESGERVVAMFSHGARLDYRDFEPTRIQVKIGACDEHRKCLIKLHELTVSSDGIITPSMITEATKETHELPRIEA